MIRTAPTSPPDRRSSPPGPPTQRRLAGLFRSVSLCGLALLPACVSSDPAAEPDPEVTAQFRAEQQASEEARRRAATAEERQRALPRVILSLDRTLENYLATLANSGSPKAETERVKFRTYLTQTANANLDILLPAAQDPSSPRNRGIACAALGFAENKKEVLSALTQAALDDDPEVAGNAIFGLGELRETTTPPGPLIRAVTDAGLSELQRGNAAWALYQVQTAKVSGSADEKTIVDSWIELLDQPLTDLPATVTVSAVRGVGLSRDASHRQLIERYLSHPYARVRMASVVALGRMGDPAASTALIAVLEGGESNENVRLFARAALRDLAGGRYAGFDGDEWRRIFDLGATPTDSDG